MYNHFNIIEVGNALSKSILNPLSPREKAIHSAYQGLIAIHGEKANITHRDICDTLHSKGIHKTLFV